MTGTDATFRDLHVDATDPAGLARFWRGVLGREVVDLGERGLRLDPGPGTTTTERVWVHRVDEPKGAKTRVHLDVRLDVADPAALVAAGATVVREPDDDVAWWVLTDPEGNELCAFAPHPDRGGPGPFEVVVDCAAPLAQATWWSERLGGTVGERDGFAWVQGAAGFPYYALVFAPVPEPKTVTNRVRWDVVLAADAPDALVDAGATVLATGDGDGAWTLADPEGNEFLALTRASAQHQ